jgi:hypothetical protein
MLFDWEHEGAGEEYFKIKHGIKTTPSDIVSIINENNDKMINNVMKTNVTDFMNSLKSGSSDTYVRPDEMISSSLQVNEEAVRIEQNILNAIRMNNPTK